MAAGVAPGAANRTLLWKLLRVNAIAVLWALLASIMDSVFFSILAVHRGG